MGEYTSGQIFVVETTLYFLGGIASYQDKPPASSMAASVIEHVFAASFGGDVSMKFPDSDEERRKEYVALLESWKSIVAIWVVAGDTKHKGINHSQTQC